MTLLQRDVHLLFPYNTDTMRKNWWHCHLSVSITMNFPKLKSKHSHCFVNIYYAAYDNSHKSTFMHYLEGTADKRISQPKTAKQALQLLWRIGGECPADWPIHVWHKAY